MPALRTEAALGHLLAMLAGGMPGVTRLVPASGRQAASRALLRPDALLLPAAGTVRDDGLAGVAHAAAHLRHSAPAQPVGRLGPVAVAVASTIEDARVERLLGADYPGLAGLFVAASRRALGETGDVGLPARLGRLHLALIDPAFDIDGEHWLAGARRRFEAEVAAGRLGQPSAFRALASRLANELGQMRVRANLQGDAVAYDYGDDHSFLWDFGRVAEAAVPVGLDGTDVAGTGEADDPWQAPARAWRYPEWDAQAARLREAWCTVLDRELPGAGDRPRAPLVRARVAALTGRRRRRQPEGDHLDLDAAIEACAAWRSGQPPPSGCYRRGAPGACPRSVLVLLDLSVSMADPDGVGGSLFARACARLVGLAQEHARRGDRLAVHGFSSNGRHQVDYLRIAGFGRHDGATLARRVAALAPRYSTRLGTAIRHAAACLHAQARPGDGRPELLVVGDAEAADIDVFHAGALQEDAAEAVRVARRAGVGVRCLLPDGVEADAALRIFGVAAVSRV